MPNRPLFLARAVYRRRRLRDAARLLPVLGLLLLILPALGREIGAHARDAIYLFTVWGGADRGGGRAGTGAAQHRGRP